MFPTRGTLGSWITSVPAALLTSVGILLDLIRLQDWGLWTDGCWSEMQEAFLNPIKSACNFSGTGHSLLSLFWNMVSFAFAFPPECPVSAHPKMSSPQNASFYIGSQLFPTFFFFWHLLLMFLSFFQMKLLNLYIKRAQTTNSNSSSSSDVSTHS